MIAMYHSYRDRVNLCMLKNATAFTIARMVFIYDLKSIFRNLCLINGRTHTQTRARARMGNMQ